MKLDDPSPTTIRKTMVQRKKKTNSLCYTQNSFHLHSVKEEIKLKGNIAELTRG